MRTPDPVRFGESASSQRKGKCCGTLSRAAAAATSRYSGGISFVLERDRRGSAPSAAAVARHLYRSHYPLGLVRDLRPAREESLGEVQPVVHFFEPRVLLANLFLETLDFILQLEQPVVGSVRGTTQSLHDGPTERGV